MDALRGCNIKIDRCGEVVGGGGGECVEVGEGEECWCGGTGSSEGKCGDEWEESEEEEGNFESHFSEMR